MKKSLFLGLLLSIIYSCSPDNAIITDEESLTTLETRAPGQQAISFTEEITFDNDIPCANDGAGEVVDFSGSLHIVFKSTVSNGVAHIYIHLQPQGLKGIGASTGDIYKATGVTMEHLALDLNSEGTYVNNYKLIGPGPDNNLVIHQNYHYTVNGQGLLTVLKLHEVIDCK